MAALWKVLLIDNNEVDLITYQRYLAGKCFTETAKTYQDAIEKFTVGKFDGIVLDYELDEGNGLTLLQQLKDQFKNNIPPVILLTGQGNEQIASQAINLGVADYLIKSRTTEDALYRSIKNALIHYKLQEDIKLKNKILRQMVRQLKLAYRNIQQLHHILSHELKTPLTALHEFIALLSDESFGPISEKQREILKTCKDCTESMNLYINDLTDISLIESNKLILLPALTEIKTIIDDAIQFTQEESKEKNIQVKAELANDIPAVPLDKKRILQVLINLLNNAIKFTPQYGKISIKVDIDQTYLTIAVIDTGLGIESEKISKIFRAYYQIQPNISGKSSGLGLGLRICKGIIEAHNGSIEVESKVNQGTTFMIKLPLRGQALEKAVKIIF